MSLFTDFKFSGPVPAKTDWATLRDHVEVMHPPLAGTVTPPCPAPHTLAVDIVGLSSSALQWRMSMVGYGDFAFYGAYWGNVPGSGVSY